MIDFAALLEEGTISPEDLAIFRYVETAEEAWKFLKTADPALQDIGMK